MFRWRGRIKLGLGIFLLLLLLLLLLLKAASGEVFFTHQMDEVCLFFCIVFLFSAALVGEGFFSLLFLFVYLFSSKITFLPQDFEVGLILFCFCFVCLFVLFCVLGDGELGVLSVLFLFYFIFWLLLRLLKVFFFPSLNAPL